MLPLPKYTIMKKVLKKISSRVSIHVIAVVLVVGTGMFVAFGMFTTKASAGPGQPFGGLSYSVFTCNCSGNYAIYFTDLTVSPAITLPLIYQPGVTTLYREYMITTPGVWILGTWQPGGSCRYRVGKGCATLPTQGTMYMVGTSM